MAVTSRTLRLLHGLRVRVGRYADNTVRDLTRMWADTWKRLAPTWQGAAEELADRSSGLGRWLTPVEVARSAPTGEALTATAGALDRLAADTTRLVVSAAGDVVVDTAGVEPLLIASQVPDHQAVEVGRAAAAAILPTALDVITARVGQAIVTQTRPLSPEAMEAIRRELVRGIRVGANPREVARRIVRSVGGAFNGGLTRATVIARTEILDAYRVASRYAHEANADILDGWVWLATVTGPGAARTCPSCWAMHGRVFPADQAGPLDHQQGRCARMPLVKPWTTLGIADPEPPSGLVDARKTFDALPEDTQAAIMGAGRLALLKSGRISWDDLPQLRVNSAWRDSYHPRPLRDLRRIATKQPT